MLRSRTRLHLEQLEDRLTPALTVKSIAGSVFISGTPVGELRIAHISGNDFDITDNAVTIGGGPVAIMANLNISLKNRPADIKIDLDSSIDPGDIFGNILIDLGTGYTGASVRSLDIYDSAAIGAPVSTIFGNVTVMKGNARETINIGAVQATPAVLLTAGPVTVLGNTTIATARSNASSGTGDIFRLLEGSSVLGSVSTSQVDQVTLGSADPGAPLTTVGRDVTISNAGALHGLQATVFAAIGRNLTVTGTSLDDSFALQQANPGDAEIRGSLKVNLSNAQSNGDQVLLGPNTHVFGSANVAAGSNTNLVTGNQFRFLGDVDLHLTVNMGNNRNSLYFAPQNPGDPVPTVGGNMVVTAGNGVNNIGTLATGQFAGSIGGNLSITLGSGANGSAFDAMVFTSSINGTFKWRSGSGKNYMQLGDSLTGPSGLDYNFLADILFGNNDDSLTLDLGAGFLSGNANGGGRVTVNSYTLISGFLASPTVISNFP